jgi:hypothetical protein
MLHGSPSHRYTAYERTDIENNFQEKQLLLASISKNKKMKRQELIYMFYENHKAFIGYINSLTDSEFMLSQNEKWTPGQQLEHILLCLKPLAQITGSKSVIESKFGKTDRPAFSYETVISNYKNALEKGGKAPEKFVPEKIDIGKRSKLVDDLFEILNAICQNLDSYTESEFDVLVLPHPLLGNLPIREMFYLMTYHATHHLNQTKLNLKK